MGYVNNKNVILNEKDLKNKIIMGIDQSFSNTSICIIKNSKIIFSGCITTNTKDFLEDRMLKIRNFIYKNIEEFNVEHVNIEGLSFASAQSSARQLAGLFYVVISFLREKDIDYSIIPPTTLKLFVTGSGKAKKEDMLNATKINIIKELENFNKIKYNSKKFEDVIDAYHLSKYYIKEV